MGRPEVDELGLDPRDFVEGVGPHRFPVESDWVAHDVARGYVEVRETLLVEEEEGGERLRAPATRYRPAYTRNDRCEIILIGRMQRRDGTRHSSQGTRGGENHG